MLRLYDRIIRELKIYDATTSTTQPSKMLKKQCKFKILKEVMVNWLRIWYFDLVSWHPRCYSSAKTIVVTDLKSTLRNSSHISASSRRLKTWKCWEWRCLKNEVGCWEYSWDYRLFIVFVLHEECFYFEGRLCKQAFKFPIRYRMRALSRDRGPIWQKHLPL